MSNLNPKLQEETEEELMNRVNVLSTPSFSSLASDELTRRSIKKLNETIIKVAEQSEKSARTTEDFTRAMYLLAVATIFISISQLILNFIDQNYTNLVSSVIALTLIISFLFLFFATKLPSNNSSK